MDADPSPAMWVALAALAWVLTYTLHSTLLLASAWWVTRRLDDARCGQRERIWKFAVLAAFVTSTLQLGLGFEPLGGRLALRRGGESAGGERNDALARAPRSDAAGELAGATRPSDPRHAPRVTTALWRGGAEWIVRPLIELRGATLDPLMRSVRDGLPANLPDARPHGAQVAKHAPGGSSDATLQARSELSQNSGAIPVVSELSSEVAPSDALNDGVGFAATTAAPVGFASSGWLRWAWVACGIGLVGAIAGVCLFGLLWLRLTGCLRDRTALEHGALADKLRDLCRRSGVRRKVRLSLAPSLGAPISMGWLRPEICVPPRALVELSDEEQEALLAHELAHVVRRDPLWLAGCRLLEGVFFFQPLHRLARHEIEDCAEFLSDAWAVRTTGLRFSLASCLTRIAEWIVGDRRVLPAPAMAHGRSRLRHRVELLLEEGTAHTVELRPRWLLPACFGFGASLVAVVPCVAATETRVALATHGDHGRLSFLPEPELHRVHARDSGDARERNVVGWPSLDETTGRSDRSIATPASASAIPAPAQDEIESPDLFGELAAEFDALQLEIDGLRREAAEVLPAGFAASRRPSDAGADLDARLFSEIETELELLELKLTRLRLLASRLDQLRQATADDADDDCEDEVDASKQESCDDERESCTTNTTQPLTEIPQ